MDPEFQTMLLRVFAVAGTMIGAGAIVLIVAFRSFAKRDGEGRGFALIVAGAAFILVCCLVLLRWSFAGQ